MWAHKEGDVLFIQLPSLLPFSVTVPLSFSFSIPVSRSLSAVVICSLYMSAQCLLKIEYTTW